MSTFFPETSGPRSLPFAYLEVGIAITTSVIGGMAFGPAGTAALSANHDGFDVNANYMQSTAVGTVVNAALTGAFTFGTRCLYNTSSRHDVSMGPPTVVGLLSTVWSTVTSNPLGASILGNNTLGWAKGALGGTVGLGFYTAAAGVTWLAVGLGSILCCPPRDDR